MLDHVNAMQEASSGFFNPMLGGDGAVTVGGGGGGGGMPAAFDIEDDKIVRCALVFGRELLTCDDTTVAELIDSPVGVIYATISHGSGNMTLSVAYSENDRPPDNGLDVTHRLLYKAEGGVGAKYWADCRGMPVVAALD